MAAKNALDAIGGFAYTRPAEAPEVDLLDLGGGTGASATIVEEPAKPPPEPPAPAPPPQEADLMNFGGGTSAETRVKEHTRENSRQNVHVH